jgi:hypothetical protein
MLATCFHAGFLLDLLFDPEDGGDMFYRNTWCYILGDSSLHNHRCYSHVLFTLTEGLMLDLFRFHSCTMR